MAAFKSAGAALDYARAFQGNTGHPQIQIRADIHIGPMHVEEGDVFGGTVNFAAPWSAASKAQKSGSAIELETISTGSVPLSTNG